MKNSYDCNYCNSCDYCDSCDSCDSCNYCNYCNSCDYCNYCDSCNYCNYCNYCNSCDYCNSCYFSRGLRQSENMIFCLGEGRYEKKGIGYQKNYMAWNKSVTEERFNTILEEVKKILDGCKIDARRSWVAEWGKVSQTQWAKMAKIPEFDFEITKKITGLSQIDIDEEKTIEIEGKKFTVSELKSLITSAK